MSEKFLVVYNICEFRQRNYEWYRRCLDNLLNQDYDPDSFQLLVSGCGVSEETEKKLMMRYGQRVWHNHVLARLPVQITFNKAIENVIHHTKTDYDGFIYIDSGMNCGSSKNIFTEISKRSQTKKYAMLTIQPNTDSGFQQINAAGKLTDSSWKHTTPYTEDMEIRIGYSLCLHFQYFNRAIRDYYGKVLPDIFPSGFESVLAYLASGLHLKWSIIKDIMIEHQISVDGPNSGTPKIPLRDQLMFGLDIKTTIINNYAKSLGLGYSEWAGGVSMAHDPEKFDEEGFAKDERLKEYLRDNLSVKPNRFDYDQIPCKLTV